MKQMKQMKQGKGTKTRRGLALPCTRVKLSQKDFLSRPPEKSRTFGLDE